MKTKVRVQRRELLKLVEGRRRKAENDYQRERDAYPAKVEAWNTAQAERLERLADKARKGKLTYDDTSFRVGSMPQRPSEGKSLCNLRRMEATLKMGAEDTILLSQEDADYYFGACGL